MESVDDFVAYINYLQEKEVFYSLMVVIALTIILNTINIVVWSRKRFKTSVISFYNILISILNIFTIILSTIPLIPKPIVQQVPTITSDFVCNVVQYLGRVFLRLSSWTDVMVSFDRMLTVSYPTRFQFIKNKYILLGIFAGIATCQSILSASNLFLNIDTLATFNNVTNQTHKLKSCTASKSIILARDLIDELTRSILPIFLQFGASVKIIRTLWASHRTFNVSNTTAMRDRKFAITILTLNVSYFITQTPPLIASLYLNQIGYSQTQEITSKKVALAYFVYLNTVLFAAVYLFALFCLNCILNAEFRKELGLIYLN